MRARMQFVVFPLCLALVQTAAAQTVATRDTRAKPVTRASCAVDAVIDSAALSTALIDSRRRDTTTVWVDLRIAQGALLATIPDTATDKSLSQELLDLTSKHARKPVPRTSLPAKLRVRLGEIPSLVLQRPPDCVMRRS